MSSPSYVLLSVIHGIHALVSLGLGLALLGLCMTLVRRHRPDAWHLLAASSAVHVGAVGLGFAISLATPLLSRAGVDGFIMLQAVQSAIGLVLTVVWFALLGLGVARLAQPPRPARAEPVGPYR